MRDEPPLDAKCKDKFLVQSAAIPDDDANLQVCQPRVSAHQTNGALQWADLEKNKGQIQERKIRVQYMAADGINGADYARPAEDHVDDSLVSPPPQYTPRAASDGQPREDEKPREQPQPQHRQARSPGPASSEPSRNDAAASASESSPRATSSSAGSVSISREELLERLRDADTTIARLRREVEASAARRRREDAAVSEKAGPGGGSMAVRTESGEAGVPLRVVFILCLIVFFLTWLMF
jgi:hypothetical protein